MTAKIYSFEAAKSKQKPKAKREKKKPLTPSEIFDTVYADIVDNWQEAARNNKLNELIHKKLPAFCAVFETTDYVNDLNVISNIERKLGLVLSINSPEFSGNKLGWMVIFKKGDEVYSGPPDMVLESYARAFNVLLYVEFIRRVAALKAVP